MIKSSECFQIKKPTMVQYKSLLYRNDISVNTDHIVYIHVHFVIDMKLVDNKSILY